MERRVETITLSSGRVVIEARPGYLLVTEHGWLAIETDVRRLAAAIDAALGGKPRRVLLDERLGAPDVRPAAVQAAFDRWLASAGFDAVALVLPDDLAITAINMRGVAAGAPVRAFTTTREAHQWLSRIRPSTTLPAIGAERTEKKTLPEGPGLRRPSEGAGGEDRPGLRRPTGAAAERTGRAPSLARPPLDVARPAAPATRSDVVRKHGAPPAPDRAAGGDVDDE